MAERNRLEVKIFGNDYVLHSSRPDEEMRAVVDFVKKQIDDAASTQTRYNKTMQVTLACINVADAYFQEKTQSDEAKKQISARESHEAELKKEIRDLQQKLEQAQKECRAQQGEADAVRKNLEESENKRLELAKQFQEFQRTHR